MHAGVGAYRAAHGRAAFSVAANIAEGVAKRGNGEFRRFLDISIGSLSEISYTTHLAGDLGLLPPEQAQEIEERRTQAAKLTWGLYKSVTRKGRPGNGVTDRTKMG